ncbi:pectin acetylesterase 8-like [Xenia sp. Carnegie-2017]|uniref:pectin acetylesterase 8-like n=1 Tax=Xenia sp. Carnegie-2017 TaxID=2897299 RepID=UPI001F047550|nr:pectin acetylesterase 8-like [Xenia sp. Carnegie-2017]
MWFLCIIRRLEMLLLLFVLLFDEVKAINKETKINGKDSLHDGHKKSTYHYNLRKVYVRNARKLNASCLDGSDAAFYISRNKRNRNWIIRLQAGGSCVLFSECYERRNTAFGSSKYLPQFMTGTFLTSNDATINPTFHKWNKVYIPYCSGDLFIGRKQASRHDYGMPMLGHYIVTSIVNQLIQDYKINNKHSKILFGGASAGGLGMLSNVDYVAKMVKPAKIFGYNDGGWFTLYRNFLEPKGYGSPVFLSSLHYLFRYLWDGFVDESCRAEMPQPAACLYGEFVIRYLSTPIFVMVSRWDSYQLKELNNDKYRAVNLPPRTHSETEYLGEFGNNTFRSIRRLIKSKRSGVFSPACVSHTFAGFNQTEAEITKNFKIAGVTSYGALSEWYVSRGRKGTYVDAPSERPYCNPTCCTKFCLRCSKQTVIVVTGVKRNVTPVENRLIELTATTRRNQASKQRRSMSTLLMNVFVIFSLIQW